MSEKQRNLRTSTTVNNLLRPALIASQRTVGEYSIFLEHLLVGLADESIPTALVCPPDSEAELVVPPLVEVVRHPAFNLPLLWRQNRKILVERLEKFRPTVLHCLCETRAPLTRELARQLGLPYVLTVNSLQKRWVRFAISSKRCAKIITPAESIAANLAKVYPRFAERIEKINIGTFIEETNGCFSKDGQLASIVVAWPLKFVGDFENLFSAVRHLVIDGYEFMLVLTGSGPAEGQLRKSLGELGLSQIAVVVPGLHRLRGTLAAGDIFIQPQPSTSFNPLLLEAISVGSVVAACKGGVDDLIIEDKTSVVFDPNDELSIYGCLQKLLDNRQSARQLAKTAQEHLRKNYSVGNMIEATLRTYREAQERNLR